MRGPRRPTPKSRANAELTRQLERAEKDGSAVQAVFFLDTPAPQGAVPDPGETEARVKRLVRRAESAVGESVREINVFRNLGSFVVEASPRLVRALADQDEVRSATPNRPGKALEPAAKAP